MAKQTLNNGETGLVHRTKLNENFTELYDNKQDNLVSGTNIKTINGNSIVGSGDLVVGGGDMDTSVYDPANGAKQVAFEEDVVPYTGATQDVDLDTHKLNAQSIHAKGTGGAGYLGLKHQSADITASTSESSLGANSAGNPVWKNDGNDIQKIMLENSAITGATKTKITYDTKGLITAGADATQDDIGDGTTYKQYSATEKTKLAGIEAGATANSSDATLLNRANHTGTQTASTISDFDTASDARITAQKGVAGGITPLDGGGKIDISYIPDSVLGQLEYQGVYDASGGTAPSSPSKGYYWIISVGGTISGTVYVVGDWIVYNGTSFDKVDNTDAVVTVFGRTGNIVANTGDYIASQITNTPAGNISSTDVQSAINELDTSKAEISSLGDLALLDTVNTAQIDNDAVTYAKMQNVSATNKVLGRTTAGAGDVEEISTTGSGDVVRATSPTLVTPILGTPTSGTLTNCTGLPIAGLISSTSTALGVGSIEIGHASDTTISRVSAGVVAIEGNNIITKNTNIQTIAIAISDETTAITPDTAKVTFRMPYAFTLTEVRASLTTVSSSGTPTFDINENGTTILSTKLTIDANEKTSTTATTAPVISDSSLADDAEITIDIDTAGTGATGAKIYLIGYKT